MKKDSYEFLNLKRQLQFRKNKGCKFLEWKLSEKQKDYIEGHLGMRVEPILFLVKTRKFYNLKSLKSILKEIHYKNRDGKDKIVMKLNQKDRRILDEYGISYYPYKYRIYLQG